jgi:hypothetical protein
MTKTARGTRRTQKSPEYQANCAARKAQTYRGARERRRMKARKPSTAEAKAIAAQRRRERK